MSLLAQIPEIKGVGATGRQCPFSKLFYMVTKQSKRQLFRTRRLMISKISKKVRFRLTLISSWMLCLFPIVYFCRAYTMKQIQALLFFLSVYIFDIESFIEHHNSKHVRIEIIVSFQYSCKIRKFVEIVFAQQLL